MNVWNIPEKKTELTPFASILRHDRLSSALRPLDLKWDMLSKTSAIATSHLRDFKK